MTDETSRIEADINRSRHALNDTIEQLGSKLSPGQLLDEALGLAQGQAGQLTANLGRQVRDNPLPLLLVGAGVAMLFMNRNGSHHSTTGLDDENTEHEHRFRQLEDARRRIVKAADETHDAFTERLHQAEAAALDLKQHAGEAIEGFKERVRASGEQVAQTAARLRDKMKAGAADAKHMAQDQAHKLKLGLGNAKHGAEDFYDQHPLAVGAIGLAVGALIGSTAPLSSFEHDKLQKVSEAATRAGASLAEKAAHKTADVAEAAATEFH